MTNYYNAYIPQYAQKALPLTSLCRKDAPWVWSAECASAFESLRSALCSQPLLLIPDLSPGASFVLETDASDYAVGAVL